MFQENIENNTSDNVAIVDFRLDKSFTMGGKYKLVAAGRPVQRAELNKVTNFNLSNGSRYNQIIATLDPRTFQLAFRFEF